MKERYDCGRVHMYSVCCGYRSSVVFHMLDRVDDLVNQLHGDPRDDALSLGECALEGAKSHSRFLRGHAREKLYHAIQPSVKAALCRPVEDTTYRGDGRKYHRVQHGGVGQLVVNWRPTIRASHISIRLVFIIVVIIVRRLPLDSRRDRAVAYRRLLIDLALA